MPKPETAEELPEELRELQAHIASDGPLIIEISRNFFGSQPLMRLSKPGATSRSKPVSLIGGRVLVGDSEEQPSSAQLQIIVEMLRKAGR